ncbi:MAG TPA: glycosyltransferase [Nitrospira sp.]|nr:glycosyltransferase [Nitrospira sp.]
MKVLFEELSLPKRAGGIESATEALTSNLGQLGINVVRSSEESDLKPKWRPDCIHIHGIWSLNLAKRWLFWRTRNVPCVVTPHGMLQPWALTYKRFKKKVAWSLYQRHILNRVSALHTTSTCEASNLKRLGLTTRVETIPWGINIPECQASYQRPLIGKTPRVVLFVGRICPVKGLPMLVEAWGKLRPTGWKVRIVGPDEAGHRVEVEALVRRANLETEFEFAGAMKGEKLRNAYLDADLFVLPSYSENFGMVVGEALGHACPVIASQGSPWSGLEAHGCGWWPQTSADDFANALRVATTMESAELKRMGQRGQQWIKNDFSWESSARQMVTLYRSLFESNLNDNR